MALRAAGRTRLAGMASQGGSTGRPSGLRAAQATGRREYTKQINLNKKASTAAFTGAKRYLFCSYLLFATGSENRSIHPFSSSGPCA